MFGVFGSGPVQGLAKPLSHGSLHPRLQALDVHLDCIKTQMFSSDCEVRGRNLWAGKSAFRLEILRRLLGIFLGQPVWVGEALEHGEVRDGPYTWILELLCC